MTAQALAPDPTVTSLPRRERERLARHREILEAGRTIFAKKGYHVATLEDVAEAVELGKATLYSYFDSKERLFESVLKDGFAAMKAIGESALRSPGGFEERIRMLVAGELYYFFHHPSNLRLMLSEAHQLRARNPIFHLMPQFLHRIAAEIGEAQARGEILKRANSLDLAVMLVNMIHGQFMSRIYRHLAADQSLISNEQIDERVIATLKVVDPATIETLVLSKTDLIFTVFFEGIRDSANLNRS